MTKEQTMSLAAEIVDYIIECSFDDCPYVTQPNGDVTYTDIAQGVFNRHYDVIEALIEKEVGGE